MSITVKASEVVQVRDLLTLYSKKSAFNIDEYVDVGSVYARVVEALGEGKSAEDDVTLESKDVRFVVATVNVCSQRTPVEVQNYKAIATLFENLEIALKQDDGIPDLETVNA